MTADTPRPGTRAAIYVRVSTPKQAADDKASLAAQERACRQFAAQHAPPLDVARVYVEPGYSGAKYSRPKMDEALADAKAGLFDWLLMDITDRFTRGGVAHYGHFLDELDEAGVRVQLVSDNLDLSQDEGRLVGAIRAYQAKKDNENRVLRRRRTYEAKALAGRYICGKRPPYGLRFPPDERRPDGRLAKDRLVADPETADVMRRMFREHARGATLWAIKQGLERDGVRTPTGRATWDYAVISVLLRNSIYWGEPKAFHGDAAPIPYPPGVVEPLVDRETAMVVQERLARNKERSQRNAATALQTLLYGGVGVCAACGRALTPHAARDHRPGRRPTPDDQPYMAYRCPRRLRGLDGCPGLSAPAATVDRLVWDALRDLLLRPDELAARAEAQAQAERAQDPSSDLARLRQGLAKDERRRDNLREALAEADHRDVRAGILFQLGLLEDAIADRRRDIDAAERSAHAFEARRRTLADVGAWATRYRAVFLLHEPDDARGRDIIREILRALGATAAVGKDADGRPTVALDVTLRGAGALPFWDAFYRDADAGDLAEFRTSLEDPNVVAALGALAERLGDAQGDLHSSRWRSGAARSAASRSTCTPTTGPGS